MPDVPNETNRTELRITGEEARSVTALLRYAISLNTPVGLFSPTQRRLATPTYKAVELAALVLEGKTSRRRSRSPTSSGPAPSKRTTAAP